MNRPILVSIVLIMTILSLMLHGFGTLQALRVADEGIMDPLDEATVRSPVRLSLLTFELMTAVVAASFLYFLRKVAFSLFLCATAAGVASYFFLYATLNVVHVELANDALLLFGTVYSYRLLRRGFLR
jgi:hypothetical protein